MRDHDACSAANDGQLATHRSHPEFEDYCGSILNYDLGFLNYARDPAILNMVEQCIGPDIAIWNSSFFAKPPRVGRKVAAIFSIISTVICCAPLLPPACRYFNMTGGGEAAD